jgi:hypothetical protein
VGKSGVARPLQILVFVCADLPATYPARGHKNSAKQCWIHDLSAPLLRLFHITSSLSSPHFLSSTIPSPRDRSQYCLCNRFDIELAENTTACAGRLRDLLTLSPSLRHCSTRLESFQYGYRNTTSPGSPLSKYPLHLWKSGERSF